MIISGPQSSVGKPQIQRALKQKLCACLMHDLNGGKSLFIYSIYGEFPCIYHRNQTYFITEVLPQTALGLRGKYPLRCLFKNTQNKLISELHLTLLILNKDCVLEILILQILVPPQTLV